MKSRTVDEKVAYNNKLKTPEATSYVVGVKLYRDYIKCNFETRQSIKAVIDATMKLVKSGNGDRSDRALIAGYRDAANERKARRNRPS